VNCNQTSAMLTVWEKTGELAFLNEVSSVALQQCLRHLQAAFTDFFGHRLEQHTANLKVGATMTMDSTLKQQKPCA
jgi:hypothetical protein